jgi:serine/threonine protein phosphatase 1
MFKKLKQNTHGQDWFVGDIHGCYNTLMDKLDAVHFDKSVDRLISVGDLIDRGPNSKKCIELLKEPWFHAVIGNHEDMMIGCFNKTWDTSNYIMNGGQWFLKLTTEQQSELVELALTMPVFMEVVVGNKKIGIVHADFLNKNWNHILKCDDGSHEWNKIRTSAIWGRTRITKRDTTPVEGVDLVVCGHTPLLEVNLVGNVLYIDTGAVYGGGLTVLNQDQLLEYCEK